MVFWEKPDDERYSVGQILDAFDELAARNDPFAYPIHFLRPKT